LIGRTESALRKTASLLPKDPNFEIYAISVTDEPEVRNVAERVGAWDLLILNAAHPLTPSSIVGAEINDWWRQYEVSVKSVVVFSQAFVPTAKSGAGLFGITAGALVMPPAMTPGYSAYLTAKAVQIKVLEFLASENPELFVATVHPGMVDTGIFRSSGASPEQLPMDTGNQQMAR
jgi:NAD(P)-dependent dehydrogenase (short-subunit alcohol dehydrogenase family)